MLNEVLRERVAVTKRQREMCAEFARLVVDTNKVEYARRGQTNQKTIMNQIQRGKMAEFAVHSHLTNMGTPPNSMVDLNIYPAADKSFDGDLLLGGYSLHIKTQSYKRKRKYGASWVFQRWDPLLNEPDQRDIVVPTQISIPTSFVEIVGYFAATDLIGYYGEPVVPHLRRTKAVLYFSDIQRMIHDNE